MCLSCFTIIHVNRSRLTKMSQGIRVEDSWNRSMFLQINDNRLINSTDWETKTEFNICSRSTLLIGGPCKPTEWDKLGVLGKPGESASNDNWCWSSTYTVGWNWGENNTYDNSLWSHLDMCTSWSSPSPLLVS